MSDKPVTPNYSLPIIAAAVILAGAIAFSAVYVTRQAPTPADEVVVDEPTADESDANDAEPQDRVVAARQQFLEQMAPLAKYLQNIEVQAVRITHNDKMMRIDFTAKAAADKPAENHYVELTEDPSGRYVGPFTFAGEKVSFIIY